MVEFDDNNTVIAGGGFDPGWIDALIAGEVRMTAHDALQMFHQTPLHELGRWADARCRVMHGDTIRTYVIDRNINYTNACTARCTFCAFRRDIGSDEAYTLSYEDIERKIEALVAIGGTQILMQGGMNSELPLSWYEDLLRNIKNRFPQIHIHAFSPPEFIEFVDFFDVQGPDLETRLEYVFKRLIDAGLDSLPGAGGEIFAHKVRRKIGYGKCTDEAWLTVMRVAHKLGMHTSATMMFGHIEGIADRIDHMDKIRIWQDRSIQDFSIDGGGRFKAFIAWPFQRENTPLGRLPEWDRVDPEVFPGDIVSTGGETKQFGRLLRSSGAVDYLRTQAISRLYLDNIYSIGASWVTMGPNIGQMALAFGANDFGSVMMEENVVSAAGTTYCLTEPVLCHLIRDAGFIPAQRDNQYNILQVWPNKDSNAPDLGIDNWATQREKTLSFETGRNDSDTNEVSLTVSET